MSSRPLWQQDIGTLIMHGTITCVVDFLSVRPIHVDPLLQNEDDVGNAIQKSDVPRSNIWLTSKVRF